MLNNSFTPTLIPLKVNPYFAKDGNLASYHSPQWKASSLLLINSLINWGQYGENRHTHRHQSLFIELQIPNSLKTSLSDFIYGASVASQTKYQNHSFCQLLHSMCKREHFLEAEAWDHFYFTRVLLTPWDPCVDMLQTFSAYSLLPCMEIHGR